MPGTQHKQCDLLHVAFKIWWDECFYAQSYHWNHKRVYRIYCELELNLRIKPRRRIKRDKPEALSVPIKENQQWIL
jgi:hypothetical protein